MRPKSEAERLSTGCQTWYLNRTFLQYFGQLRVDGYGSPVTYRAISLQRCSGKRETVQYGQVIRVRMLWLHEAT
jgi:hypothetical protein